MSFTTASIDDAEKNAVLAALSQGHIHANGPFARRCEDWLEANHGAHRALLTHSCTAALEMAALLAGIAPGDEVILPSFTFVSTANACVLRGATPVFVDIREDTLNLDERLVSGAITERTRAIVPVHYGGVAAAMDELMDMAQSADLIVIEDAAQAITARSGDRFLGTLGHLGCLTFHATENVVSGQGGALFINDPAFVERAEILREKGTDRAAFLAGQVDKCTWQDLGSSYLMNELSAALLWAQLSRLEEIQAARMKAWQIYHDAFAAAEEGGQLRRPVDVGHNAHVWYLRFGSLQRREHARERLRERGIEASFHYVPLHSSPAGQRFGRLGSAMDVTDKVAGSLLRLPLHSELTSTQQERVISEVLDVLG